MYSKLDPAAKAGFKNALLGLIISEPEKVVRVAIAGATASLAKYVLSLEQQWPEIFALLVQLLQNPNETSRQICFSLLAQVITDF